MLRRWCALIISLILLTGCTTPSQLYSAYQQRANGEELVRAADAIVLATVGDSLPSYSEGQFIYTDTTVSVVRGREFEAGAQITLKRHGGRIEDPGSNSGTIEFVDYLYFFPAKGGEVFLLLKKVGEKYEIIDAMPLVGGKPMSDRPEHLVYLSQLEKLK